MKKGDEVFVVLIKLFVFFALGMFAIIKGADWFTDAAVWIAGKTGIPKVIVGATIVSLATTLPEFAVSVFASYSGHADISLGNAVGSNIFNIGVILGISLLIRSCPTDPNLFPKQAAFMITAGILAFLFAQDGSITRMDGFLLLLVLAGYLVFLIVHSLQQKQQIKKGEEVKGTLGNNLLKFIGGTIAVVIGSRITVTSGIGIAEFFKIPELIIGLTLVAMGTSLPELVTSLTATLKGYQELSVGNIIGAGLLNMSWVTSVSAIVNPIPITPLNLILDFPFMLTLMGLLLFFGITRNQLVRWEGAAFLLIYAAYLAILLGRGNI